MNSDRITAFTDGVLAIIITIMVLELEVPEGESFPALVKTTGPMLLTYILSFIYVGIYWNNHHHMFALTDRVTGAVLWANLHLLFWLSLLPFTTAWMDESGVARIPLVIYGVNLLLAAISYTMLQAVILRGLGGSSRLRRAIGRDIKGKASVVIYLAGIGFGLLVNATDGVSRWLAIGCFVFAAMLWVVPDSRLERAVAEKHAAMR